MGYTALIERQITAAFNRVKDLAIDASLIENVSSDFNFNSKTLANTPAVPRIIKIVVTNEVKKSETVTRTVMAKGTDVVSFSQLDTLTLDGYIWRVGDIIKQSGKVWVFNIFRTVTT